jgi:hypothetical protein
MTGNVHMNRKSSTAMLLALILAALGMIFITVAHYPSFLLQPGASAFIWEPVCALIAYAVSVVLILKSENRYWPRIHRWALIFGILTGVLEILNIVIENDLIPGLRGAGVQISFMLLVFTLWGIAGGRAARVLRSIRAGLVAAAGSSGICMLIAVPAGFVIEFFVAPPNPAYVSTWAEFKRSGWTDAHAFGIANALDSGFTHLVMAPLVALLFGLAGALLTRSIHRGTDVLP